jgi:hypothetical protein
VETQGYQRAKSRCIAAKPMARLGERDRKKATEATAHWTVLLLQQREPPGYTNDYLSTCEALHNPSRSRVFFNVTVSTALVT